MFLSWHTALYLILGTISFYQASRIHKIFLNYNAVKALGLPIVIAPVTWQDPLWIPLYPYLSWLRYLPFCSWVEVSNIGWSCPEKSRPHQKYGNAFIVVSPHRTEFFIVDPVTMIEVTTKWKVWTKEKKLYSIFDVFGPSVNTVNGEDWQRHRKITGGAFRESNYRLVWNESRKQATQMLEVIAQRTRRSMHDVRSDVSLLTMHVLTGAAFGKSIDYGTGLANVESGHQMSYFTAIVTVLMDLMASILLASLKLPDWLLPNHFKKFKLAMAEFKQYLIEEVDEQRMTGLDEGRHDLAAQLLHANEIAKDEQLKSGGRSAHLTDEELYGNMAIFNIAGFETTATSLSFTIPYLALKSELQDWIKEEVTWVKENGQYETYEDAFPELKRCLALMYETLRLHPAIPHLPRLSPDEPVELRVPMLDRTITIPPGSFVPITMAAMQRDERFWGQDALVYNPKRWITTNEKGEERLIADTEKEGYTPWLIGPRVCPGKKFSQVEFVAVIATLLENFSIRPANIVDGQTAQEGWEALNTAVENPFFNMSPKIIGPEKCGVEFVAR